MSLNGGSFSMAMTPAIRPMTAKTAEIGCEGFYSNYCVDLAQISHLQGGPPSC